MKENYHLTRNGRLVREENTVYYIAEEVGKRPLPVEKIHALYAYGRISFTSGVISYLAKNHIPLHFFNYYGYYEGTFYPREFLVSGDILVSQVEHYLNNKKRMEIAREFVRGAAANIEKNLSYYERSGKDVGEERGKVVSLMQEIDDQYEISNLMRVEGAIRNTYYSAWDEILPEEFRFVKRTRRPPENAVNALISFGNSLMYAATLSEIYNTQLNPTVSYLHSPSERRFSLSLDISEVFKPIIVDRVIFKLLNKKVLTMDDFSEEINRSTLTEKGRRKFLQEWESKMADTIMHRGLKRKVSYRSLVRMECYKLEKHLIGGEKYRPLIMWW